MIRLRLLEGFAVRDGGEIVALPLGAQRLVAFLALHERPVHRLYVAGCLWPDSTEEHASASLRSTLWRLGRRDCALVRSSGSLVLLEPGIEVDLRDARERARAVLCRESAGAEDIEALCRTGELLPGWFDDWVLVERERFRQLLLHSLDALCTSLSETGRHREAVEAGRAAVAAEPLRESANQVLIEAYLAAGNRSDALRQYRLFRDLLAAELGLAPSARLGRARVAVTGPVTRR